MTLSLAINLDPPAQPVRAVTHFILAAVTFGFLLAFGWPVVRRALTRRITLELLFLIGIAGTFAGSLTSSLSGTGHIYYEVILVLLAIHRFGRLISERQTARISGLASQVPGLRDTARVQRSGGWTRIPPRDVRVGDRVRVEPEEAIPADGRIVAGQAFVEELAHTGEPFPVVRGPGAHVLAGTRVLDGTLEIQAAVAGDEREVDRLYSSLQSVPATRAESLAQRVLDCFVPAVVLVAIATFAFWWGMRGDLQEALFHALAVTIVACPCGLGLAIPIAARRGSFRLRLLGITPQSGDFLDRLSSVDTVAFDKTGTLSHPRLELTSLDKRANAPEELEAWLAAVQLRSIHPVARPFWSIAAPAELPDLTIESLPGRGISAHFSLADEPQVLTVGNETLRREWEKDGHPSDPFSARRTLTVFLNGIRVATAQLNEQPRESALETIEGLRAMGLRVELLTGDSALPADYRDRLDHARTSLTSQEKAKIIRARHQAGRRVLYVGDWLNDVDALRAAHASIGLQSGGPIAPAAAHATLDHDDLSVLPEVIRVARGLRRQLRRLFILVLSYNVIGIGMAALGYLHPVPAALLMLVSSVTVLSTAVRMGKN